MSNIEWTEQTWNPIVGCSRISMGCQNCYAEVMTKRLEAMGQAKYAGLLNEQGRFDGVVRFDEESLLIPLKRKKPTTYFVNSMSDLFHESIPDEWIDRVFAVMALCPQHTFQCLTKRADRMERYADFGHPGNKRVIAIRQATVEYLPFCTETTSPIHFPLYNVWLGVSAENQEQANARIPHLLRTPAAVRFVSAEPLLGPIDFTKYIGYNPMYASTASGSANIQSSQIGVIGDTTRRFNLESGRNEGQSLEQKTDVSDDSAASGREPYGAILAGENYDRRRTHTLFGTSASLVSHSRSTRADETNQSQERMQERQSTLQFGTDYSVGKRKARGTGASSGKDSASMGGEESREQVDEWADRNDSHDLCGRGDDADAISDSVSGVASDDFEDCTRRSPEQADWGNGRLHTSATLESPAQQQRSLHLIICGGESGPGARPCNVDWIRSIVGQCKAADVPVFVKQLGSRPVSSALSESVPFPVSVGMNWNGMGVGGYSAVLKSRKGGDPDEWPEDLRVREMPEVRR